MSNPAKETSLPAISASPLENQSVHPGPELPAVEDSDIGELPGSRPLKVMSTSSDGSEHVNNETLEVTNGSDINLAPHIYTGPVLQPLLRLTSATVSSLNREHYLRVCIDVGLEPTIISSDYGATVPWPDYTVTWKLFGVEFMLEGTEIWDRADLPIKGVDAIFGLGFLRRFNYMTFESTPEGYILPSRYSAPYPLLPYYSNDQRILRVYTNIKLAPMVQMIQQDYSRRPILGIGVFLGPEVSLNTWIPCFNDHIEFLQQSEMEKQEMCEVAKFETFFTVIEAVKGRSNISPFVRVELYTNQDSLVTWWNSISKGEFPRSRGLCPNSYNRLIRLRKRLAIDMGSNESDCLQILSYKDSDDSNRSQNLLGCEQAKALAELALTSSRSKNVLSHDCYLKYFPWGRVWVSKENVEMTMDKIFLAYQIFHRQNDNARPAGVIVSSGNLERNGPGKFYPSISSDNIHKERGNDVHYIQSKSSSDAYKSGGAKLLSLLTDGFENQPITPRMPKYSVDYATNIDEQRVEIVRSSETHEPKAEIVQHVSQLNSHDHPNEFARGAHKIPDYIEMPEVYKTNREDQYWSPLAEAHAKAIISKAHTEADNVLSQAKMVWAEGIDFNIMASAMATKIRSDAEADAQKIRLQTLGEVQAIRSQTVQEIRHVREQLRKSFEVERPIVNLVAPEPEPKHTRSSAQLIIDKANEKAKEILEGARRTRNVMLEEAAESILAEKRKSEEARKSSKGSQSIELVKKYFVEQSKKVEFAEEAQRNAETKKNKIEIETGEFIRGKEMILLETEEILKKTEAKIAEAKEENEAIHQSNKRMEADLLAKAMQVKKDSEDIIDEATRTREHIMAEAEKVRKDAEENRLQAQRIIDDAKVEAEKIRKEASEIAQQVMKERDNEEKQRAEDAAERDKLQREQDMRLNEREEMIRMKEEVIKKQDQKIESQKAFAKKLQERAELLEKIGSAKKQGEVEGMKAKREAEVVKKEIETLKKLAETLKRDIETKNKEIEEAKKEADAVKESIEKAQREADLIREKAKTDTATITEKALKMKKEAEDAKSRVALVSEKIKAEAREEAAKVKAHSDKIIREAEAKKREAAALSKKILSEADDIRQSRKDAEIAFALVMEGEREEALRVQKEEIAKKMAETNKLCEEMKKTNAGKIMSEYKKFGEEQEKNEKAKKNLLEEIASQKKKAKDEGQRLLDKANEEANRIIENAMKAHDDYPIRGDVLGSALPLTPESFYKMFLEPKDQEDDGPLSAEDFIKRLETAEASITLGQIVNHCPDAAKDFFAECEREGRLVHRIELYKDTIDGRIKFKKGERIIPFAKPGLELVSSKSDDTIIGLCL